MRVASERHFHRHFSTRPRQVLVMLTFASVQGPHEYYSSKSQLANDDSQRFEATDVLLAADDVDPILSGSSSKLCVPGQSIASAAAFMRSVLVPYIRQQGSSIT